MRKLAAVLTGLLAAMLCLVAVASAGITAPTKVTASVRPAHVKKPPYKWITTGIVKWQKIVCPKGTTDPDYCTHFHREQACRGTMQLKVVLGQDPLLADSGKTIGVFQVMMDSHCRYRIITTFPNSVFTATQRYGHHDPRKYVNVYFKVKFLGNAVLNAKAAPTQTVVATIINHHK